MRRIDPNDFRYSVTEADYSDLVTVDDVRDFTIVDLTANAAIDAKDVRLIEPLIDSAIKYFVDFTGVFPVNASIVASLDYSPAEKFFSRYSSIMCDCWLNYGPIVDVTKIFALNEDATEEVLDAADYVVDRQNSIVRSLDWPIGTADLNSFQIEYTAGLGATKDDTPEEVKTAIKMIVTHWFEYRQPGSEAVVTLVPEHARAILNKYKPSRL